MNATSDDCSKRRRLRQSPSVVSAVKARNSSSLVLAPRSVLHFLNPLVAGEERFRFLVPSRPNVILLPSSAITLACMLGRRTWHWHNCFVGAD